MKNKLSTALRLSRRIALLASLAGVLHVGAAPFVIAQRGKPVNCVIVLSAASRLSAWSRMRVAPGAHGDAVALEEGRAERVFRLPATEVRDRAEALRGDPEQELHALEADAVDLVLDRAARGAEEVHLRKTP